MGLLVILSDRRTNENLTMAAGYTKYKTNVYTCFGCHDAKLKLLCSPGGLEQVSGIRSICNLKMHSVIYAYMTFDASMPSP